VPEDKEVPPGKFIVLIVLIVPQNIDERYIYLKKKTILGNPKTLNYYQLSIKEAALLIRYQIWRQDAQDQMA